MKRKQRNIKGLIKPEVKALRAYVAQDVPCKVKLDANESPHGFRLKAEPIKTNRYPDPEGKALRRALGKTMKLPMESVLLGNGSDELISCILTALGGPVLIPTPTFAMYAIIAKAMGLEVIEIPLDDRFDLDAKAMLKAIKTHKPRVIFLSSPNNPTGNCYSSQSVLRIIEASAGIVVLDEAYGAFASDKGYAPLLADYNNLAILRTLSKVGLAALRVGYLAADPVLVNELNKVRLPFNINSLSQAYALQALKASAKEMRNNIKDIVTQRAMLMGQMEDMYGISPYPSEANFILFKADMNTASLHKKLLKRGVLIKDLGGIIKGHMRVTVGTAKENRAFCKALKESIK